MNYKSYYDISNIEKEKFFDFLKDAFAEKNQPAHINMWDDDWHSMPNTLPYILEKTNRFKVNGQYQLLFDDDTIVACSGCYKSEFSDEVAMLGVRTWIHKDYRNKLISRHYLLPVEKQWAAANGYKAIMLTFNDYNKNLMALWSRKRLGEKRPKISTENFGFNGTSVIDFPILVQYTKQYGIYEKLDSSWNFDWETIRYS